MKLSRPSARTVTGLIVSGVFIYAGVLKIADPAVFREALESYRIVPTSTLAALSYWIPWVEFCLGGGYWIPAFRRASLSGFVLLLLIFSAALLQAAWRGLEIGCGCFGSLSLESEIHWAFLRNAILTLASLWLIMDHPIKAAESMAAER